MQPEESRRKLRFGAFINVPSCHPTGWRHPEAATESDMSFAALAEIAGCRNTASWMPLFFQDSAAVPGSAGLYGGKPSTRAAAGKPISSRSAPSPGWRRSPRTSA